MATQGLHGPLPSVPSLWGFFHCFPQALLYPTPLLPGGWLQAALQGCLREGVFVAVSKERRGKQTKRLPASCALALADGGRWPT